MRDQKCRAIAVLWAEITLFGDRFFAIATYRYLTRILASVVVFAVGVIALLFACFNEAVATTREGTRHTGIGVQAIRVVALLFACKEITVSAGRLCARRETRIGVVCVSVVTRFPFLDDPVATLWRSAVVFAGVAVLTISVVAKLDPLKYDAVTASFPARA